MGRSHPSAGATAPSARGFAVRRGRRGAVGLGGVGFIQIDAGRIGGLAPAKRVADYARERGVTYVNHTFTSHLALSASLQPYAGHPAGAICEYPRTVVRGLRTSWVMRCVSCS